VLGACWDGSFGDGTVRRDEVQGKGTGRRNHKKIKMIKKINNNKKDQQIRERKEENMGNKK
jgi:hypothetical protein